MQETWVQCLSCKDPLEKEMATHSNIIAWKIPWTEEPSELQLMGLQRIRHDWFNACAQRKDWYPSIIEIYDLNSKLTRTYVSKIIYHNNFKCCVLHFWKEILGKRVKRNGVAFKILATVEGGRRRRQATYNCSTFPKDWSKLVSEIENILLVISPNFYFQYFLNVGIPMSLSSIYVISSSST